MEKVRLSLQMFGKILFAQSTEMIDPTLSGGLPANLAADNPSLSFTMKGVDINMAAYMAELSYLANPMSSHAQAAEMHNQSVNSMALASARMTFNAIDVLTKMSACSVYIVCQALDLRALHMKFVSRATDLIVSASARSFSTGLESERLESLTGALRVYTGPAWSSTGKLDLLARCEHLVDSAVPIIVTHVNGFVVDVLKWKQEVSKAMFDVWNETFESFLSEPHTMQYLGKGSRALYQVVRHELGVPFHQGFVEHPTIENDRLHGRPKKTIGGWISILHDSIKSGILYDGLMAVAEEGLLGIADGLNGETNGHINGYQHEQSA